MHPQGGQGFLMRGHAINYADIHAQMITDLEAQMITDERYLRSSVKTNSVHEICDYLCKKLIYFIM